MPRKERPRPPVVALPTRGGVPQGVHKAYMRLACLELERTRYQRERATVLKRIQALDERLSAIEAEQRALQGQTPQSPVTTAERAGFPAEQPPETKDPASRRSGFSFRY